MKELEGDAGKILKGIVIADSKTKTRLIIRHGTYNKWIFLTPISNVFLKASNILFFFVK